MSGLLGFGWLHCPIIPLVARFMRDPLGSSHLTTEDLGKHGSGFIERVSLEKGVFLIVVEISVGRNKVQ